jgi:hypothetical protein
MNKILSFSLFAAVLFSFAACKKINTNTDGTSPVYTPPASGGTTVVNPLGDMPQEFTKKVVIEEATAIWCGYCPYGAYYMNEACKANPDKVYGVAIHRTDAFYDLYDANTLKSENEHNSTFSFSGIPAGVVNRDATTDNYNVWGSAATAQLAKTAAGGLGIITKKLSADQYSVEVHAGFNATLIGDYRLVLYVLEDEVHNGAAYDQHNYTDINSSDPNPSSAYYNSGDPMTASAYKHNHALRQTISGNGYFGDAIDATKLKAKGEFVKTYTVDIDPTWNVANTKVLAMIIKKGTDAASQSVENAQECKLGSIKKWD